MTSACKFWGSPSSGGVRHPPFLGVSVERRLGGCPTGKWHRQTWGRQRLIPPWGTPTQDGAAGRGWRRGAQHPPVEERSGAPVLTSGKAPAAKTMSSDVFPQPPSPTRTTLTARVPAWAASPGPPMSPSPRAPCAPRASSCIVAASGMWKGRARWRKRGRRPGEGLDGEARGGPSWGPASAPSLCGETGDSRPPQARRAWTTPGGSPRRAGLLGRSWGPGVGALQLQLVTRFVLGSLETVLDTTGSAGEATLGGDRLHSVLLH